MHEQADLNDLVLKIYDTAIEQHRWSAVLDEVARFVGARGALIFEIQGLGGERRVVSPHFSSAYDPVLVRQYLDQHGAQELKDQDEFTRYSRLTDGIELVSDEVLTASEAELLARPNVQQMMKYGMRYRGGALLNKDQVNQDRFSLQFSSKIGSISSEHYRRSALIMPHIAKALNVARPLTALAQSQRTVVECLDMLVVGVCVLDANGCVVLANTEFQRQLDAYGVFRKHPSGRLVIRSEDGGRAMSELTGTLDHHGRFGARPRKEAIVSTLKGKPHTLCIEVTPLHRADAIGESRLQGHVVYSLDTGNLYAIDAEILAGMFGLTGAESLVLEMMAEGLTNGQISERRSKSIETVNSQVKSILEKTRSANRTQAIRLATNISASFLVRGPAPRRDAEQPRVAAHDRMAEPL